MIIKENQNELINFLSDASNYTGKCEKVYIPESISELKELVKDLYSRKAKITIAGNGTGLTGGRVPNGGVVISTEKLNRIIDINSLNKTANLEPGVLLGDFQELLKKKFLFYPPDPTETNCFIGATAANNSSGAKSFKYGSSRNFIIGLNILLPDGNELLIERGKNFAENSRLKLTSVSGKIYNIELPDYKMPNVKNASGYFTSPNMDAIDLFIGSEGTLGIIVGLKVKLIELPENFMSGIVFFDDEDDALNFITEAGNLTRTKEEVLDALALEFFDVRAIDFLRDKYSSLPPNVCAVWFEQEIYGNSDILVQCWSELITSFNGNLDSSWFAFDEKDRKNFVEFRHTVSSKISDYVTKHNITKTGTDTAVPDIHFKKYYFQCKDLVEKSGIRFVNYGHFGNSHMHLNMLPKSEKEFSESKLIYRQMCKMAIDLGGTISAEHGIGKFKTEYLKMMYGEKGIRQMAKVKMALDPNGILNSGNLFDESYVSK